MNPQCIVCASETDHLLDKDGYSIYECPKCKLSFVHPQPEHSFLKDEVYSEKSGYQANKARDLNAITPTPKQERLLAYLKNNTRGSLLDVGSSSGEIMHLAGKLGYSVKGVELNPRTAHIAKQNGLDVFIGTLIDAQYTAESFDYVHMGDFIEHVTDPCGIFNQARRVLKSGGQLIVITPNMSCFFARTTFLLYRLFKIPWSVITPPHHLFQFSVSNLRQLLEQNGFKFETIWYTDSPALKYELGSLHLLKRWKNRRTIGNLFFMIWAFSIYTLIFGINRLVELFPVKRFSMAMIAKKI